MTVQSSSRNIWSLLGSCIRENMMMLSDLAMVSDPSPTKICPSSWRRSAVFSSGGRSLSSRNWKIVPSTLLPFSIDRQDRLATRRPRHEDAIP